MNERIQELAVESGLYVDLNGTPWPRAMSAEESEAAYKKFAELIVRECIDIIAPYTVRMSRPGEEYLHPIQEIKDHFGVEE
jgi:hypothetical protein